jgi:hypothetical protein
VKRTALALALILALLFSAMAGAMSVKVATADPVPYLPNITIKSDGSVEPQTELVKQDGNVYTLTNDLVRNYAIKIQRSNIVFDGGGHVIDGSFTIPYPYGYFFGLRVESVTNVTVKDIEVIGSMIDIYVENTINSVFLRVKTSIVHIENSDANTIAESTMLNELRIIHSNNNTFRGNNFYSTLTPIGTSNIFYENNFFKKYEGTGSSNFWDNGSIGNYWVDYKGVDDNGDGIGDTPYVISSEAQDRFPLMNPWDPVIPYDTVPPRISIVSPENKVYNASSVPLTFLIYETSSSMSYSLDGQNNVTVAGNTTVSDLPNGAHNLTVYVTDSAGNTGASETISFSIEVPEPFPTALVATASAASATVIGVGLLVYFKKRKH